MAWCSTIPSSTGSWLGRARHPPPSRYLQRIAVALDPGDADDPDGAIGRSLLAWAARYVSLTELRDALERARSPVAPGTDDHPALILATAHGTKGLEFDHVAVVGMDDDVFPSRRSIDEAPEPARALDEERRRRARLYVAWTRARQQLVLVHDPYAPSSFLHDAFDPDELRMA